MTAARIVVFSGDLIEESGDPAIDADSDVAAWPGTLDRLLAVGGPDAIYVPGHGSVVDAEFVRRQQDWLQMVPPRARDDVVEHRDGELSQRRVNLAEAGLKRGIDRRRVTAEERLVDVVAGELRRLIRLAEVDEQVGRQARILRHRRPVPADQCPIPG